MNLELRRIRSFCAVAEHGGFRAAAEALGISQPTLSAHIAELEAELQVPLVARTTRRVRLTPMGERFLVRARRALDELRNAALELQDAAALERGRVTVACTPTVAVNAVPAAIRLFRDRFPGIEVVLVDDVSGMVERRIAAGEVDLAIAPKPERLSGLSFQSLTSDRFVAVFPAGTDLPGRAPVRLKDIAGRSLIAVVPGTSIRTSIARAFAAGGYACEPAYEVRHHWTLLALVEAGLGIGLLPETAVPRDYAGIVVRPLTEPVIVRDIGLILRLGEKLSPPAAEFVAVLKRVMTQKAGKPNTGNIQIGRKTR